MRTAMTILGLTAVATIALPATARQAAPAAAGKTAFAPCAACHGVAPGQKKIGPTLHGVVGRKIGGVPGYAYSTAMKGKAGNWTPAALDAYLADPRGNVPGTKMIYPGIKDPAKRAAIVAYLATLK